MPSDRPISPMIVSISFSDFWRKFLVLRSSAAVFSARSAIVRIVLGAGLRLAALGALVRLRYHLGEVGAQVEMVVPRAPPWSWADHSGGGEPCPPITEWIAERSAG